MDAVEDQHGTVSGRRGAGAATARGRRPGAGVHRAVLVLLAAMLVVGATGCTGAGPGSSGAGSGGAGSGGAAAAAGDAAAEAAVEGPADQSAAGDAAQDVAGAELPGERRVVRTASLLVEVADVAAAVPAVERVAVVTGGLVGASSTASPTAGEATAQVQLRVPADRLDDALERLAALGRVVDRTTSATDVTAEVADVGSRVASAEAVLATFRARLVEAEDLGDVLALETEIAQRQADLEALQARQRVLADQVALATLDVALTGRAPVAAAGTSGFTGGLLGGWGALLALGGTLLTAAGAVLPFAAAAALLAAPVLLVRRRRRRRAAARPGA